ncbi:HlyD family efflux transporter periplasmic adaptor subunit [Cellulomonas fimi]|uniref:Biotin/lipoyl attachment domain-containing protein n=1 Tax=Cellulomonas fimi (strain ATCC 484 / DSM 20113 / JCM 1341 / CCUG 24087 / LMG 16345 / NBRC 15513 / NCIMB 8980 / NCTC 7547 / NRS-133) TaxID=590998 RepID=F4H2E7_CELFA|nr:HlyD family efflux transporter periplasmic adaptor subunit [Cellulomonas fimi]AEE47567.1 biotin/lipoyl attachment domain-containing protein [Cellulomonas fimi ATCC 484]NNH07924.1 HlyD family efflux transporter periplasmic adaptor subunit [Cellulomonas fimi]VEH36550.1 multidrug resistance protein MdtN [Cellulomonas fimi]
MTWGSRIRLAVGVLVVAVLAALATYQLNETRGVAQSNSAQILARSYSVGTPYAGLVVDQLVDVGDTVKTGDPLFVIDSATLQYDIRNGFARQATEATQIDAGGRLVVLATGDGTVTTIGSERGTFVQSASELATVQRAGTLYVQAEYTLSAKEYARVPDGADVTIVLPNQREITATVDKNTVETVNGQAQAVFTIKGSSLKEGAQDGLVSAGTPVTAELHLENDGVVTRAADSVKGYLEGIFG